MPFSRVLSRSLSVVFTTSRLAAVSRFLIQRLAWPYTQRCTLNSDSAARRRLTAPAEGFAASQQHATSHVTVPPVALMIAHAAGMLTCGSIISGQRRALLMMMAFSTLTVSDGRPAMVQARTCTHTHCMSLLQTPPGPRAKAEGLLVAASCQLGPTVTVGGNGCSLCVFWLGPDTQCWPLRTCTGSASVFVRLACGLCGSPTASSLEHQSANKALR